MDIKKNQTLYIDGERMDIDEQTQITLDLKSNLLRDVSKIVSNSSYTVKLPKTVHNQRVIGHTDLVRSDNNYPYIRHQARYFRGGVEIIRNGRAVLLSTGDDIQLSLVWGLYPAFSSLVEKGTTLNQLLTKDRILWNISNTPSTYDDAQSQNFFYADLDVWIHDTTVDYTWKSSRSTTSPEVTTRVYSSITYGGKFGGSTTSGTQWLQPSVKVSYLLQLIKEQTGIDFQWSGDALDYINTLIIPLISRKANSLTYDGSFAGHIDTVAITKEDQLMQVGIDTVSSLFSDIESGKSYEKLTVAVDCDAIFDITANLSWDNTSAKPQGHSARGTERTDDYWYISDTYLRLTVTHDGTDTDYVIGQSGLGKDSVPEGYKGEIKHELTGKGKIELKKGDTIQFHLTNKHGILKGTKFYGATISATLATGDNVPQGGYFPLTDNLPKIKIIDFVKFLAAITGTFPRQIESDNKVTFVEYSVLWDNIGKARDWTDKLIALDTSNKPRTMNFTLDDWKQNNWYRWKEDDTVVGNYDGDLTIDNSTLDIERDVFTFPFAATDGSNVPIREKSSSSSGHGTFGGGSTPSSSSDTTTTDSEPSYKACKDRILRLSKNSKGNAIGIFDINMQSIINDKYADLSRSLQKAKVIKEKFRMRDIELTDFDETIPVYLRQYGTYFAVTEIKSNADGTAEVTLMEMNINNNN